MVLKCFNLPFIPPPSRDSGKERIQGKWTCLERFFEGTPIFVRKSVVQNTGQPQQLSLPANTSQIHQQYRLVESGEQIQINRQPGLSFHMSQQKVPGRPPGKFSAASLSKAKISEDMGPTSIAMLAAPASQAQPSPLSTESCLYPSKHHMSSTGLVSPWVLS